MSGDPIDLAHEADFSLGAMRVRPSLRAVIVGGTEELIEPRVMQVLVALARRRGEVVSRDDLVEQCWSGRVVGDDAISRPIAMIRKLGETSGAFSIETIPRIGYRIKAANIPVEPEAKTAAGSLPKSPEPEREAERQPLLRRRHLLRSPQWVMGTGGVVALAAIAVASATFLGGAGGKAAPPQTAFFGFESAGDGITQGIAATANEETVATLTAMHLSTTATAETIGTLPTLRLAAAERLHARYAVSGDVRAEGSRVKVTVRLEDVPSRAALWSQTLEGDGADPLGAQAAALATDTLNCFIDRMQGREQRTAELGAIVARHCRDMRSTALDILPATRELAQLVPDSATIQGTLGLETLITLGSAPPSERANLIAEGEAATLRAMKLDPDDPWANLANYQLLTARHAPVVEREQALRRGLQAEPSEATLNFFLGRLLASMGMTEASLPHLAVGVAEDPLSAPKRQVYAQALAMSDRKAEAEKQLARAAMLSAPTPAGWQIRAKTAVLDGVGSDADLLDHPAAISSSDSVLCWRDIRAAMKENQPAKRTAAAKRVRACAFSGAIGFDSGAIAASVLGDLDTAFALAEQPGAWAAGAGFPFVRLTAPMRQDTRFEALVESQDVLAYWRAIGKKPDFCKTEDVPVCARLASR